MQDFYHLLDGTDLGFVIGVLGSSIILLITELMS